ncbi:hypothetical protein, partial [Providencia alcalifaciens]|uniref:hypothetical protein n=1 Tax=Providencia alcalifaciens TaxID=126385 RepID=UPI002B05C516
KLIVPVGNGRRNTGRRPKKMLLSLYYVTQLYVLAIFFRVKTQYFPSSQNKVKIFKLLQFDKMSNIEKNRHKKTCRLTGRFQ